jgi:SET domain-containing protein
MNTNEMPSNEDRPKVFDPSIYLPGNDDMVPEYDEYGFPARKSHSYYVSAYIAKENKFAIKTKFIQPKVYVGKSKISGLGVFASEDIKSGDIIEECPVVLLDSTFKGNKDWVLNRYAFAWGCGCSICEKYGNTMALVLGNGMVYNHSEQPNGYWTQDTALKYYTLHALTDIKQGEEITWYYGAGYSMRLKMESKMTFERGTPEGWPPSGKNLRDSVSGGGCSSCGNKNEPIELVKEDLPESKPTEEKTAEDLLFRSMVVPEKILNDKVQEGTV